MTNVDMPQTFLVTGGAGFIGSNLVHYLVSLGHKAVVIDKLTYAGNKASLFCISPDRLRFEEIDICDTDAVSKLIFETKPTGFSISQLKAMLTVRSTAPRSL